MTTDRGRIVSIDARGRMTLHAGGLTIVAQVLHGGGWIGDIVEGRFDPGAQLWRNVGNGITSAVHVQMAEVGAPTSWWEVEAVRSLAA